MVWLIASGSVRILIKPGATQNPNVCNKGLGLPLMKHNFKFPARALALLLAFGAWNAQAVVAQQGTPLSSSAATSRDALLSGWQSPPEATKPYVYWYWLNNIVTKSGITRDLEAMASVGIGGAYIGHIGGFADVPRNSLVKPFSNEWYELMQHAVREGKRTGVKIGVFNGPGWSQSGGPWVKPEEGMTYIDSVEVRVQGGQRFDSTLPRVKDALADVRVIAFPAPMGDGQKLQPLRVTSDAGAELALLSDGKPHELPEKKNYVSLSLTFEFETPQLVRSIEFQHASGNQVHGTLAVSRDGIRFETMRSFTLDRRSGPQASLKMRPSSVSLPPTTARFIRIEMPWDTEKNGRSLGIAFSSAARVEMGEEKQLGIASRLNLPPWDNYLWPKTPEPGAEAVVSPDQVVDLTHQTGPDGRLSWDVPAGEWIVQRLSTVPTGARSSPTPNGMGGLEIDKMSRAAAARHINDGMVGELWRRLKPEERSGFAYAIADSYEVGFQNWTPNLEKEFQGRYGYDGVPFLPVLSGRVVGSAAQSDRFLWDLRRLVADLIAENYVGGLREAVHPLGLQLWLEPYGHWGFPSEFLKYGGQSDGIGGEFWLGNNLGAVETRAAASTAHIYGKNRVSSEAFTSSGNLRDKPADLKARGDWAFAQGVNHYVLHVVSHQPTEVPGPGLQLLWGVYFNRKSLWFAQEGRAWVDYVRRTSYLLQQGRPVADVAYFIGEDTPQMTGTLQPQLPSGYDFDWINAEVLLNRAKVEKGRLVLPGGASYRVLVLPPLDNMRPELLEKISQLVNQGLNIVGPAPTRSPSLQDYPRADARVQTLAAHLWPKNGIRSRKVGLGGVWNGAPLGEILASLQVTPALLEFNPSVLWKQRSTPDAEIFYLSNQTSQTIKIAPSFRVSGRAPQVWNAETARTEEIAAYREEAGRTIVPMVLEPLQSVFVVFRRASSKPSAVVEIKRDGQPTVSWVEAKVETQLEIVDSNLFHSFWVKPEGDIRLPVQKLGGIELTGQRWILAPLQGTAVRGAGYAGAGVSVGRNGVAVIQHWGANAPAVLVWRAPAPLDDWMHVIVAYRAGVPQLYINGKLVQSGLKSGQRLMVDEEADTGAFGSPYSQVRGLKTGYRALDDLEIATLSQQRDSILTGATRAVSIDATRVVRAEDGSLRLQTSRAGNYTLRLSNGQTLSAKVAAPLPAQTVGGPWQVEFVGAAAPPKTQWVDLKSWSDSADELTKYFSGSATYTTTFQLPATYQRGQTVGTVDLGKVESVARVTVNGMPAGTALRAPYQLDVSPYLKPGANELRVLVTSNWGNRMIGDEQFPDDLADIRHPNGNLIKWPEWALNDTPRPEPRRITLSARKVFTKDSPLQPSGLIGPVTLSFEQNVSVR